jgi:hypothetical protein
LGLDCPADAETGASWVGQMRRQARGLAASARTVAESFDRAKPTASAGQLSVGDHDYPENVDARLLRIAGVCGLASMMGFLDGTVVAVSRHRWRS